ncbi:DBF4-type zinc finger-containing protein 2 isoform X2 [Etheostoma cragini]|uniref:DBF4-type zinc finger-containing protein 2 isoform X2 n=1 Tax=Etheostoma cragini TaxID=417921 RepID=UPI00155EC90F|nr:DBF4-type zinc finger-containing protein 2 isoform X2 [Etheostoma cragini]
MSDEGDQRKDEDFSRMWAEPEPGPSSRQGYCGYCRVLYSNLDQHLSSLRHLDSVRASNRGTVSAGSRAKLTLLERFLQDVLKHHPHNYHSSPSHADLPPASAPPMTKDQLNDDCRDHLGDAEGAGPERLSAPIGEQQEECPALAVHTQTPPPVHRKAHRKTNRRKTSNASCSSQPHRRLDPDPGPSPVPVPSVPGPWFPWLIWQKQRRKVQKEEAFSSDHSDSLDRTIEEVIQMCCHGDTSPRCPQEETESFHLSLPVSMETQSKDWDSPVQVRANSPVQVGQAGGRSLVHLMEAQVQLEDPVYSDRLDSALQGGGATDGFLALPIDQVLPAPQHFPESFRGKSWVQIQREDEEKVEDLVQQFRRGGFLCYFDSESLARYGRRRNRKKAEPDCSALPSLDGVEVSGFRKRRRRGFRVASRCQVVKVSRSTQTLRLVVPAVREAPPPSVSAANKEPAERTPVARPWRSLPASYRAVVTPLQPCSQLLFLLCSPSGPAPLGTLSGPAPSGTTSGPAHRRCRKKTRPLERRGSKVTYKPLPFSFYEPGSNRILSNAPRGVLRPRGPAPRGPAPICPPPCVRQLFRSLSPDLNADSFSLSALGDKQEAARRRGRGPPPAPRGRSERRRGGGRDRTRPPPAKRRTSSPAAPRQPKRDGLRRGGASEPRRGRSRRGRGSERRRS